MKMDIAITNPTIQKKQDLHQNLQLWYVFYKLRIEMQIKYQCTTCDPFIMIKNCISIHYGQKLQSSVQNGKNVMYVSVLALYNIVKAWVSMKHP